MILLDGAPFLCGTCFNAEIGYRYRPVRWPSAREAIEAVLLERPAARTRNFTPVPRPAWGVKRGDTVASLRAENAARGMGGAAAGFVTGVL